MKEFSEKWVKRVDMKGATVVLGIPGVANIAFISTDYLISKTDSELVAKIYSNYLPAVVFIDEDSTIERPCFYLYKLKRKKVFFLITNNLPKNEEHIYLFAEYLATLFKKKGIKRMISIAGIAYKEIPRRITLYGVTTNKKMMKSLEKKGLKFTGNKNVSMIIGLSGLLLDSLKRKGIDGFSILVSTFAHQQYVGIKESKKVIEFLMNYLKIEVDLSDLVKEINRINKLSRKKEIKKDNEQVVGRYIG